MIRLALFKTLRGASAIVKARGNRLHIELPLGAVDDSGRCTALQAFVELSGA